MPSEIIRAFLAPHPYYKLLLITELLSAFFMIPAIIWWLGGKTFYHDLWKIAQETIGPLIMFLFLQWMAMWRLIALMTWVAD